MTARARRHLGLMPVAAVSVLLLTAIPLALAQDSADDPEVAAEEVEPDYTGQVGLPPELLIDLNATDDEESALESSALWIDQNKPQGGWLSKIGKSITGLFSKDKSLKLTVGQIAEDADKLDAKVVTVEGLYATKGDVGYVTAGGDEVRLTEAPAYILLGIDDDELDGMPVQVTGTVILQDEGPEIRATEVRPAPALTYVRLARINEIKDTIAGADRAYMAYSSPAGVDGGATPWGGFAMTQAATLAVGPKLRRPKDAGKKYQQAWDYEGRVKASRQPGLPMPTTWEQDPKDGLWIEKGLREAVADPFDQLNRDGFWYKFVNFFVAVCGDNAGIGLILMAVVTRLLLYPLTRKQLQSSKAMQKLQPQIKGLQEKHGKDKQKFQEDFWKLCRENKVNPLGGCLPLLVQMPLLWMVYKGIRAYVVQLADHRFLWVDSLADPNIILLILYTISFIAFQKLTMKTQPVADPQQQQQQNMMVWMMPIMFFVFFQQMASGFILYWLGTNLIYLPQQYFGTRVKKKEGEEGAERTVTLQAKKGSEGDADAKPGAGAWLNRLKEMTGGKQEEDEGEKPASYEQKKKESKRKRRSPTRRRRRQ